MEIAERIKDVCSKQSKLGKGVMPPQVCPFCFGCPIATIVVGVSGNNGQVAAKPIPQGEVGQKEVNAWLDRVEAKLAN